MTITYIVARRDIAKAMRSVWFRFPPYRLFLGLCFLLVLVAYAQSGGLSLIIFKLIISVLFYLVIVWLITTVFSLFPRKGRGLICEHTFTALSEEWIEKTAVNETHGRWESITGVIETKRQLLMIIDNISTHVIPRSTVDAIEYRCFLEAVLEAVPKEAYIRTLLRRPKKKDSCNPEERM